MAGEIELLQRDFLQMTMNDRKEEQPASLSISHVYRLIEIEKVEMDKRAMENRRLNSSCKAAAWCSFNKHMVDKLPMLPSIVVRHF